MRTRVSLQSRTCMTTRLSRKVSSSRAADPVVRPEEMGPSSTTAGTVSVVKLGLMRGGS